MSDTTDIITVKLTSAAITFVEGDFIQQISLEVDSGTCDVQGSGDWRGFSSDVITLAAGKTITLTAKGPNAPIVGLVITANGGTTNLVMLR
jgi:hypothetical protein